MNWLLSFFREDRTFGVQRSTLWPYARKQHLLEEPLCAVCGDSDDLEVHHIIPVHVDKTKEVNKGNLITLCRRDHIFVGHLGSFRSYNPTVRADAAVFLTKILNKP